MQNSMAFMLAQTLNSPHISHVASTVHLSSTFELTICLIVRSMRSNAGIGERLALIAGGALALALVQLLQASRKAASTKGDNVNQRTGKSSVTTFDTSDMVR